MNSILPDPGELCPVRVDHGAEARPLVQVMFSDVLGSVGPLVHSLSVKLATFKLPGTLDFTPSLQYWVYQSFITIAILVIILPVPCLQTLHECPSVSVPIRPQECSVPILQVVLTRQTFRQRKLRMKKSHLVHPSIFVAIRVGVSATAVFFVLFEVALGRQEVDVVYKC